jgi:hypothetical protein
LGLIQRLIPIQLIKPKELLSFCCAVCSALIPSTCSCLEVQALARKEGQIPLHIAWALAKGVIQKPSGKKGQKVARAFDSFDPARVWLLEFDTL